MANIRGHLTDLVILFFSSLSLTTHYNELYPPPTYTDQCEHTFILLVYVHQIIQLTKPTYTRDLNNHNYFLLFVFIIYYILYMCISSTNSITENWDVPLKNSAC